MSADVKALRDALDELQNPFGRPTRAQEELVLEAAEKWVDALSTPPADDVREALAKAWDGGVRTAGAYGHEDTWTHDMTPYTENPYRGEVRPHGTLTDAEVEAPALADDCGCEDREALVRPEGLVCGTCGKVIEAAREVHP